MKNTWHGDRATRVLMRLAGENVRDAAMELAQLVRDEIAIQGPPRSEPGEPPHMDTQRLIASYGSSYDTANLASRVGSDVPWSAYLEAGTPHMRPRPHLVSTLIVHADDLARIVVRS